MHIHKTDPQGVEYYIREFSCRRPLTEPLPDIALCHYLDAIKDEDYGRMTFWAAGLLGAQKALLEQYFGERR